MDATCFTSCLIGTTGQYIKRYQCENDFAYDVLEAIENEIVFRDKGFEFYFDLFDPNLEYRRSVELVLDEKTNDRKHSHH